MKVVIDTNCWFAILPKDAVFHQIYWKMVANEFELVVSNEIIKEYEEIIRKHLKSVDCTAFIALLEIAQNVAYIEPSFRFKLIEADPDDNKFVDCAISGNAMYLVSDDRHFDILKKIPFPKVAIIRLKKFSELLP
jgi:uncharacterized protein